MPNKTYYFISGLPRSGSTLLTGILNQNPNFHSGITDALYACFRSVIDNLSDIRIPMNITENTVLNMVQGLFDGFYCEVDRKIIFNTNRVWPSAVEYLYKVNPNFKIICMVRNYNAILNSLERVYKSRGLTTPANTLMYDGAFQTVWHRTNRVGNEGFVKAAYECLKEAYYGPYRNHLLLVEYDDLVSRPAATLKNIYDFIEQPYYEHDFENVVSLNEEFDAKAQAPGLHRVKGRVEPQTSKVILPPELWYAYSNREFWRQNEQAK